METKKNNIEFIPKFEKSFLLPRYWGAWLGVFAFAGIALTPASFRDPILGQLGRFVGRLAKSSDRKSTRLNSSHDQISYGSPGKEFAPSGAD